MAYEKVVDADGYILEPTDVWENSLESRDKERGIRFENNAAGADHLGRGR